MDQERHNHYIALHLCVHDDTYKTNIDWSQIIAMDVLVDAVTFCFCQHFNATVQEYL